jgi:hypothetical protein
MQTKEDGKSNDWIVALGFAAATFGLSSIAGFFASYWWFQSGAYWFAGAVLLFSVGSAFLTTRFVRRLRQLLHESKG